MLILSRELRICVAETYSFFKFYSQFQTPIVIAASQALGSYEFVSKLVVWDNLKSLIKLLSENNYICMMWFPGHTEGGGEWNEMAADRLNR